jgi:flagellar motor switch protein FliN/FliY
METSIINTSPLDTPPLLEAMRALDHVPVEVHAELDRKIMTFGELLNLQEGDVIAMPRAAGENINVYVGGALIGWGEVVLMDGALAVRIADLRDPSSESKEDHASDRRTT